MRAARLQNALERLTAALRDVEREHAAMKAEHDPLASHIFVSRRHYKNVNDTKGRRRHEMKPASVSTRRDNSAFVAVSTNGKGWWARLQGDNEP